LKLKIDYDKITSKILKETSCKFYMITCFLQGGLGNQLFQIFTTISYAIKSKTKFNFLFSDTLPYGIERPTYWNSFLLSLKMFTVYKLPLNMHVIKENGQHFVTLPNAIHGDVQLHGYFQSYKYFENYWDSICKLIKLDKQKNIIQFKHLHNYKQLVSMHFRIGDYKYKQNYHPIMGIEYYKHSIDTIIATLNNPELKILYFCEEQDREDVNIMIEQLQKNYEQCKFIKVDSTIPDWEQMLMMSLCEHNIIANSTFSWWGAYFNSNPDKIVCYPDVWFGSANSHISVRDLFPESWTKVNTKTQENDKK